MGAEANAGGDPFARGGPVGADLARVAWAATPLGPPARWPSSLASTVRMVLSSRFSMWMAWGPELTFFCNDAYRRDTLGSKYPWALGRPASEVWSEIWPAIGPRIAGVLTTGEATWDEGLLLFLERSGYQEETYHTFSYSPLRDEIGDVVGMLCVVTEDTERVISTRRMSTLSGLGGALSTAQGERQVVTAACSALARDGHNLPFTMLFSFDEHDVARLVGSTGAPSGAVADPSTWPLGELTAGRSVLVDDLGDRGLSLPTGAWEKPPEQALAVPLQHGDGPPSGFLVAGLNRHRVLDDAYRGFVALVAGQVAAALAGARAYDTERERAERLAELDRAKTSFFTNVSHELRTPLTLLLGPAEDALADTREPLPEHQRQRIEVVERNAQRLLKLVNTLLDFSRLEAGEAVGRFVPLDLCALTADLVASFDEAARRAGLALTVSYEAPTEQVYVDHEMWAKVVLNLLSNAVKFTFTGGIEVRLTAEPQGVRLDVRDTGTGIPESARARLFERFHRVEGAASRSFEGSGIGLALVAELVALHGGTVSLESEEGVGSTFTVRVPYGRDHLPADQVRHVADDGPGSDPRAAYVAETLRWLAPAAADDQEPTTGRPRVLVVDDNQDMRDYVRGLLSTHYDVLTAADGLEGLARAREEAPDLVLTDVMMPGLDGFGLLAALRADPRTTGTPVVVLSARAGDDATVEGLEAGADDYLVKPFSARELIARVRANLELDRVRRTRTELERSSALLDQAQRLAQIGSWEVDLATGAVRGTEEFYRQLGTTAEELASKRVEDVMSGDVHPDDRAHVEAALHAAVHDGTPIDYEVRLIGPLGTRTFRTLGEVVRDETGAPAVLRGSNQDITGHREAERAMAEAHAAREAAVREHRIADELQASLLPARDFDPDHLQVATYYRAGVEGTQVGGDWYDVIELGAGRTALVMGDVMGRGVRAAAVMGQLRSAVRAYAHLDLPPADVLENLDRAVRDLGTDQIVTCVYAVYDPGDRSLVYANAGHLPPLLCEPGQPVRPLLGSASPPLGIGGAAMAEEHVVLAPDSMLALYTDGLVELRDRDIDAGIMALAAELATQSLPLEDLPASLVATLLPQGPDDDIAVLLARIDQNEGEERSLAVAVEGTAGVAAVRHAVQAALLSWGADRLFVDDVVLVVSELATNALIHGKGPVQLRLRSSPAHVVLEVEDHATYLPRRMRPTADDEHGRGLQLTSRLSLRWGTRPTREGKVVWGLFAPLARPTP
ncbi:MAG: SpoIIE family protein phosphatase [Mycobacteriales bacterium]|nr:SpoIIE family protein phosphatase [Mycobacteriales bacterium]